MYSILYYKSIDKYYEKNLYASLYLFNFKLLYCPRSHFKLQSGSKSIRTFGKQRIPYC